MAPKTKGLAPLKKVGYKPINETFEGTMTDI